MKEVTEALARVTTALPAGEDRPGQVEMAEAVARAISGHRHLVVQAGTGTGKSLAYLVPALMSGRKVVVATATKALQDQLAGKDLPFVAEHLGRPVHFAVLKGRSNYLCRQRAREVAGGDDQLELDEVADEVGALGRQLLRLVEFGRTSETGDRAELDFEPRPQAWSNVSVTGMECPGAAKCPSGDECFAELARQRAEDADVVVVNTHLYGAHLASGGHVLPEHDVVVFDEAHELEDVAAASLGLELSAGRFHALARNSRPVTDDRNAVDQVDDAGLVLERALAPWLGKRLPATLPEDLTDALTLAGERVRRLVSGVREAKGDEARSARALQAGGHLAGDIAFVLEASDTDVVWVEGPAHAPALHIAPVDVGAVLAEKLWSGVTAVLTSATIPNNLPARLGIEAESCETLDVGSPFDYESNTLLYCAAHLPDPRRPEYEEAMHAELEALLRAAEGRTLALFTSWRGMNAAADALRDKLPWRILTQSDLPKPALVAAFSSDEHASLFATMGFWQGVDVPGQSLSQVVIDKLPFARPDDPLLDARRERAGSAAFRVIDLPRAATLLAQGAGRLIRTATDRGVVAVLDPRLAKAGYRWDLVRALPPMKRTKERTDVEAFFAPLRSGQQNGKD